MAATKPAAQKKAPGALVRKTSVRVARFDTGNAKRVDVEGVEGLKVSRGYRNGADKKTTEEYLVLIDGRREVGMPLAAVGQAIIDSVITDVEIDEARSLKK